MKVWVSIFTQNPCTDVNSFKKSTSAAYVVRRAGLGVGDGHLDDGDAVHDGADAALVLEADLVQHQTLAIVEPDPERPFLPLDEVAVHLSRPSMFWVDPIVVEIKHGMDKAVKQLLSNPTKSRHPYIESAVDPCHNQPKQYVTPNQPHN